VIAGFIVWLAGHASEYRVEPDQRWRCPVLVEQFLAWQRQRRDQQQPCGCDTYATSLREQGATPAQVTEADHATQLLTRYLNSGN
jgi:hypothetical protein